MGTLQAGTDSRDAEELRKALMHVEQLQDQIDMMRPGLEALVLPLASSQQTTAAQVARETRDSATAVVNDLKNLRQAWESEQTRSMLSEVQKSASTNPDMGPANDVPAWGWSSSG